MMQEFPFSKSLFWDVDTQNLDVSAKRQFITERVLNRGSISDLRALFALYGREQVIETIKQCKDLDAVTHNFCMIYFGIPKQEMYAPSEFY